MAGNLDYSVPAVDQHPWVPGNLLSTAQATLGTDRSAATVEALTSTGICRYKVPSLAAAISISFATSADADANVVEIYARRNSRDGEMYEKVCGITLTGGKQICTCQGMTGVYSDTAVVVASSEVWPTSISFSSQADDGVAKVNLNTHGYKEFLFIATTLASQMIVNVAIV